MMSRIIVCLVFIYVRVLDLEFFLGKGVPWEKLLPLKFDGTGGETARLVQ
jgi:hypothetical protein